MALDPITVVATCFAIAAERQSLRTELLYSIYDVERGRPGLEQPNTNGTFDLGLMQINTIWLGELSAQFSLSPKVLRIALRDDACFNIEVAAWILKGRLVDADNFWEGVGAYHSRTPELRDRYIQKVKAASARLYGSTDAVLKGAADE